MSDAPLAETLVTPPGSPRPLPVTVTHAGSETDRVFDEAVRDLLHRRLRFCARVGALGGGFLLVVSLVSGGRGAPGAALGLVANALFCAIGAIGLVVLRGQPSLARLRAAEVGLFGSLAVLGGALRYVGNIDLPPESPDPRHATVVIEYATAIANLPVYFLIFFYGLLVPTTRRRGLAVVIGMAAVPLAVIVASAVANPALRPHVPVLLAVTGLGVTMAGAGAVFGASRINTLQRRAFEAERRADELGPYTLTRKLGAGGMGEVWLAEHRLLKRPCAVKFVRADLAANPATAARFEREVRAVTALTHFNTVRIYDYGRGNDGSFYYVMEYLEGPTFDALVKERGPLAPGRAVHLLRQLCAALAEAHTAGMVHRDIKPANVIVATLGGQKDVAKLLDFGLVQDLSTAATGGDERLTQAGVVMGTPAFMCPEQAGGSRVDARGDVYALGALAFFVLTGRPPFERDTVGGYIAAHLTEPAPPVTAVRPDAPPDLTEVVAKCLRKDPGARFQSAAELAAALAACRCVTASERA